MPPNWATPSRDLIEVNKKIFVSKNVSNLPVKIDPAVSVDNQKYWKIVFFYNYRILLSCALNTKLLFWHSKKTVPFYLIADLRNFNENTRTSDWSCKIFRKIKVSTNFVSYFSPVVSSKRLIQSVHATWVYCKL